MAKRKVYKRKKVVKPKKVRTMAKRTKRRSGAKRLSAGPGSLARRGPKRRRRRKGMLSEGSGAGKAILSGGVGGAASVIVDYVGNSMNAAPIYRAGAKILGGYAFAKFAGMKYVGAGMAGAGVADLLQTATGLSEGGSANYANPMQAMPAYLSEDGSMALSEDQAYMLSQGADSLAAGQYIPSYAPVYNY